MPCPLVDPNAVATRVGVFMVLRYGSGSWFRSLRYRLVSYKAILNGVKKPPGPRFLCFCWVERWGMQSKRTRQPCRQVATVEGFGFGVLTVLGIWGFRGFRFVIYALGAWN